MKTKKYTPPSIGLLLMAFVLFIWALSSFINKHAVLRARFDEIVDDNQAIVLGFVMVIFALWSSYIYFSSLKKNGISVAAPLTVFFLLVVSGCAIQVYLSIAESPISITPFVIILGLVAVWSILELIKYMSKK
jgi:FtsH-binding integral membrane protein